jgi:zinc protease
MKRLTIAALVCVTALCAQTPAWKALKYAPLQPLKFPDVDEFTLPNGMRVMMLESHTLPIIRGTALIRTGNLFDPAEKVGLASVTGAVIRSGGISDMTGDQIDEALENVAASIESSIGESSGTVSFSCLKENKDQVLGLFKKILTAPEFRQNKIDLIKQQTMSEIMRRNDDAGEIAQREFTDILYGRHNPYGWDEQMATVAAVERPDVLAFYKRYFFPSNVLFAIQGDFDHVAMRAQIEKLFADWTVKQAPVPPFPAVEFTYKPGSYLAVKEDATQTNISIGEPGGELKDPDFPALAVMSDILGGGFNSRLFQHIRTQLGLAYEVGANWGANYDHPGLFSIYSSTPSQNTVKVIEASRQEVERIRTDLVSEQELEEARETVLNSFVFYFDTPGKTLNRLATYRYFNYPKDFIFQYQKAVAAVTREDVLRVAQKHLDPARFVVLAVGNPKEFGEGLNKLGSPVIPVDLNIPVPESMRRGMGGGPPK